MKNKYFHKEIKFWIFRTSIYWLNEKFTLRFEISFGWD